MLIVVVVVVCACRGMPISGATTAAVQQTYTKYANITTAVTQGANVVQQEQQLCTSHILAYVADCLCVAE